MLQSWANRRKNVRLAAEIERLVAEVVGDRKGKISRNKVDGHVQHLKPAIPNRKRSHDSRTISFDMMYLSQVSFSDFIYINMNRNAFKIFLEIVSPHGECFRTTLFSYLGLPYSVLF